MDPVERNALPPTAASAQLQSWARAASGGDAGAFDSLCRALQDDIWRYCHALLGDRELAFEAAQETFLRLVTAIRRFRDEAPVKVFVLMIARRSCARTLRTHIRHRDASGRAGEPIERAEPDASGVIALEALVAALPTAQREAFVCTQVLGLAYEEAAAVLGCPVGTIRSRVFRARDRLVAELNAGEGVASAR